jgi:hypothetical protein
MVDDQSAAVSDALKGPGRQQRALACAPSALRRLREGVDGSVEVKYVLKQCANVKGD